MSIDLFSADFSRLGDTDLFDAISDFTRQALPQPDRAQEGYTVDFKEKWGEKALKEVAAFANTFGGIIFVGVSEEGGRAKDLVGEPSPRELKTRLASSIASNISPCPNFDVAECLVPGQTDRRIAVIRVRSTNRIHFLMVKEQPPVYVRNEDEAIPARAAELRNLIQRERDAEDSSQLILDQARLINLLPISKAGTSEGMGPSTGRIAATSYLRVWAIPAQSSRVELDYDAELTFQNIVSKQYPADSFADDIEWGISDELVRDSDYVRLDHSHVSRDLQSKWVFTNKGEFGFATVLAEKYPPGGLLWSLPDLTMELLASVRSAHELLARSGYLGELSIYVSLNTGGGKILEEQAKLPFLRHTSGNRLSPETLWPEIVPKRVKFPKARDISCFVLANFYNRTDGLDDLVANLLNQLLRSLGQGAVSQKLKKFVSEIPGRRI